MVKLSVVIATYNEEKNIKDCLESVKDMADEIVVVDGSSEDNTVKIVRQFNSKVYVVSNQPMFHKNKQLALDKASGDWILQLDADERVTGDLRKEILSRIKNPKDFNGFYIPRKNHFLSKWLRKGGQYPDYVIRLVKKGKAYFPCESVHEQIEVEDKVGYLKNDLIHLANASLTHYWRNANRYTSLAAKELSKDKAKFNITNIFNYFIWLPVSTFFNIFIRHKGFEDGLYGFLFAYFSSLHHPITFVKYMKAKISKKK